MGKTKEVKRAAIQLTDLVAQAVQYCNDNTEGPGKKGVAVSGGTFLDYSLLEKEFQKRGIVVCSYNSLDEEEREKWYSLDMDRLFLV